MWRIINALIIIIIIIIIMSGERFKIAVVTGKFLKFFRFQCQNMHFDVN